MQVFSGQLIVAAARTLFHPRRLRLTPTVAMMQDAGVNALPIVFIMTFFIGAIIALVGTNLLTSLGIEVFTVQLVGVALRSEAHTSELQSLMRNSYAVFCLNKKR